MKNITLWQCLGWVCVSVIVSSCAVGEKSVPASAPVQKAPCLPVAEEGLDGGITGTGHQAARCLQKEQGQSL